MLLVRLINFLRRGLLFIFGRGDDGDDDDDDDDNTMLLLCRELLLFSESLDNDLIRCGGDIGDWLLG